MGSSGAAEKPVPTDSVMLPNRIIARLGIFCSCAGFLWAGLYAWLHLPACGLPVLYGLLSLGSLWGLKSGWASVWVIRFQLLLILVFPPVVQACNGGVRGGHGVILWSALAPLCAAMVLRLGEAKGWLAAFLSILVCSAICESLWADRAVALRDGLNLVFWAANLTGVVMVTFGLLAYANKAREIHLAALEDYNRRLEELDRLKTEFLSTAAHELRTPLTSIKGFLRLLGAGKKLTGDQIEYVNTASDNADRLYRLVNDLLDLSKLQSGLMPMNWTTAAPGPALQNALAALGPLADGRQVHLSADPLEGLPEIRADHEKLEQVAVNLLGNALKFTPVGGKIRLGFEAGDGHVHFWVADSGPGMPPEVLARIFEKFYQAPQVQSRVKGTGLGLTISQKIVELHGGRIWAESEIGKGSTFHVRLPKDGPKV